MTYAIEYDVAAPIELYDAVHAEVLRRVGSSVEGLLLHVGRPSNDGFQVIEVWESRQAWQRYNDEVIAPITGELRGGQPPIPGPVGEEFEIRGLVLTGAAVAL